MFLFLLRVHTNRKCRIAIIFWMKLSYEIGPWQKTRSSAQNDLFVLFSLRTLYTLNTQSFTKTHNAKLKTTTA